MAIDDQNEVKAKARTTNDKRQRLIAIATPRAHTHQKQNHKHYPLPLQYRISNHANLFPTTRLTAPKHITRAHHKHICPFPLTLTAPAAPMKRNDAIILILFLVAVFCIVFAWFLMRSCRRVIDAEVHEMIIVPKDIEAQRSAKGKN